MGICPQQHRVAIGMFNNLIVKKTGTGNVHAEDKFSVQHILINSLCVAGLITYVYLLLLLMALFIENTLSDNICASISTAKSYPKITINSYRELLNSCFLTILYFLSKNDVMAKIKTSRKKHVSFISKISDLYSLWVACLNLALIVICNPTICNPGPQSKVSVLYQNVNGFIPFGELGKVNPMLNTIKLSNFQAYIFDKKPDIVLLNETWLSKNISDNEIFPNQTYKVFRLDRSLKTHPMDPDDPDKYRKNGGGILIAIKSDLNCESTKINVSCKAEILSIQISIGRGKSICLCTFYRVNTLGVENHRAVDSYLRSLAKCRKYNKIVLIGDLNLNKVSWPGGTTSSGIQNAFLDTFDDVNLDQLIDKPTHINGKTLDLLLTNSPQIISKVDVKPIGEFCKSDHSAIDFLLDINISRKKPQKRKIFNFKKANWGKLNDSLRYVKWNLLLKHCDANTAWLRFKSKLLELCRNHIPTITIKSGFQPPWFDNETFKLCRKKERLRAKYKHTNKPEHYKNYSNCRKELKFLIQDKMRANLNDDENDPALISKKFWSHVKSSSNSTRIPESVSYNGQFRNNAKDQAELFNIFFHDQFSEPSLYNIPINFKNDSNNFEISHTEVRSLLKNLNPNKAQGPDGIHGLILKNCAVSIAYPLSLIFNNSYKTGIIPKEWKLAHVVPIHKKGSKSLVENYRPISLTCLTMKIFEKLIRNKIMSICEQKINQKQHGFLPEKSCTTQMIPFYDNIALTINDLSSTDVIYFDFAKAFDSVNHDIILHKLKHKFHIDGLLLKFLMNYLQDREQLVVIGGSGSNTLPVKSGVPQGSILGPLLFVLFINDISDSISPGTNIALYADDTKIWRKIDSYQDQQILQTDINSLYEWSEANKMKFHPDKCNVLTVTSCNQRFYIMPFDRFTYCLNNVCLNYVETEKDLGIHITSKLNWKEHVYFLCSKANRMLGLVQRSCHFVKNREQRKLLCTSLVFSQFNHCSQVWRPDSIVLLNKIERVQLRALKWILSEQHVTYTSTEYFNKCKEMDLLPLKTSLDYFAIILYHRIINNTVPIKLPNYINLVAPTRLRYSHTDPLTFVSLIKPRITKKPTIKPTNRGKQKIISAKIPLKKKVLSKKKKAVIKRKKVSKSFKNFKKRSKLERIYGDKKPKKQDKEDINEFTENKVFYNSYFYKTHIQWNNLPLYIRMIEDSNAFKIKLREHLWENLLSPGGISHNSSNRSDLGFSDS